MVLESPHLGDHSPILLPTPSDAGDEKKPEGRRLRVGQLSDKDWMGRGLSLRALPARIHGYGSGDECRALPHTD